MVTTGAVAAIGNFDGVHLGHRHLLARAKGLADSIGAPLGVVLFEPHPRRYFRPSDPPFLISSSEQRDKLLGEAGVEKIFALPFNEELVSLSPEHFVENVLHGQLGLAGIAAGSDFRFGKARAGDVSGLARLASEQRMACEIVELLDGPKGLGKFGSTAIREAIIGGDMRGASAMLGRHWAVTGAVEEGQKRGRTIGFPTANVTLGEVIEPRFGVYATRAIVGGRTYDAVSNFGRRPTVGAPAPLLETHVFDFDGDLYGHTIAVEFIDFIRDEKKFDDFDALKAQIIRDSDEARRILAAL